MNRFILKFVCFFCLFLLAGNQTLVARHRPPSPELTSINIVDRNGISEMIGSPDRLKKFAKVNFLQSCPYQKVLRVFKQNERGEIRSIITTYYPNGQIKQYLEGANGRANGRYREWHSNGNLKLSAIVVGGTADIGEGTEISWLFDGLSRAWDEEGRLVAEIPYLKGVLEGTSKYFHPNGSLWKSIPYHDNFPHGAVEIFLANGEIFQKTLFSNGLQHGESIRYWSSMNAASRESFQNGKLYSGLYFDPLGKKVAEISNGNGIKAIFSKDYVMEYQQFSNGLLDGEVTNYNKEGKLLRLYHVKNEKKEGFETFYYESLTNIQPKLSLEWREDQICGQVKTWYPNGQQESQREFSSNQKNGISTAWYQDGNLMLIEEYIKDRLLKGEYYKIGEKTSVSRVAKGRGIAHIYDAEGNFLYKINYENGKPIDNE